MPVNKKPTNPLLNEQTLSEFIILEENFVNHTQMSVASITQLVDIYTVALPETH